MINFYGTAREPRTDEGIWIGFSWVMIINEWFVLVDRFSFGIKRFPNWYIKLITRKLFLFIQKAHDTILCVAEIEILIWSYGPNGLSSSEFERGSHVTQKMDPCVPIGCVGVFYLNIESIIVISSLSYCASSSSSSLISFSCFWFPSDFQFSTLKRSSESSSSLAPRSSWSLL